MTYDNETWCVGSLRRDNWDYIWGLLGQGQVLKI